MKDAALAIVTSISLLLAAGELHAQPNTALADPENVLVYPSIAVAVNKAVVIRLPRKATRVFVTQPEIAEVVVVAPDQLLIHGRSVGATSLVVWFEEKTQARKQ
jgi:pilus assembly protein CpaC